MRRTYCEPAETRVGCVNAYPYSERQDVEAEETGVGQAQAGEGLDDLEARQPYSVTHAFVEQRRIVDCARSRVPAGGSGIHALPRDYGG
jgi:hypothetical protein